LRIVNSLIINVTHILTANCYEFMTESVTGSVWIKTPNGNPIQGIFYIRLGFQSWPPGLARCCLGFETLPPGGEIIAKN
jgi:hypothetical protein